MFELFSKTLFLTLGSAFFLEPLPEVHHAKNFNEAIKNKYIQVRALKGAENKSTASTLLISCVDFRLREETERLMSENLKLLNDYDEIALPGAALALTQHTYPDWNQTLEEVIGILKGLHHIKRIIFLDHRQCGAFKLLKGEASIATRDEETRTHKEVFKEARKIIQKEFPDLEVYTLLIGLDAMAENFKE